VNRKPQRVKVLERNDDTFLVEVNEKRFTVKIKSPSQGKTATIEIDGKPFQAHVERILRNVLRVKIGGKSFEVQYQPKITTAPAVTLEPKAVITRRPIILSIEKDVVTAPIAGRIVLVRTKTGQKIERGACICVLEAMKMQNEVAAVKAGVVKEVRVSEGAIVDKGDVLAVIA